MTTLELEQYTFAMQATAKTFGISEVILITRDESANTNYVGLLHEQGKLSREMVNLTGLILQLLQTVGSNVCSQDIFFYQKQKKTNDNG